MSKKEKPTFTFMDPLEAVEAVRQRIENSVGTLDDSQTNQDHEQETKAYRAKIAAEIQARKARLGLLKSTDMKKSDINQ